MAGGTRPDADWRLQKTYSLIHRLQPNALIGNNHHRKPVDGEDFQMVRERLAGRQYGRFQLSIPSLVACRSKLARRSTTRGVTNKTDKKVKSTKDLVQYLVRAAGSNANFLLNVGPIAGWQNSARVPVASGRNGAVDQGQRRNDLWHARGPFKPRRWGVATEKGSTVYVHILDWQDELLALPKIANVKGARMFKGGAKVEIKEMDGGMVLRLPKGQMDPLDTIVVLDVAK